MQKVFRVLVLFLVLFLLSGCILNEFFAVTQKPGETQEEFEERQAEADARLKTWATVGMGLLAQFWPAAAAIPLVWIGRGRQLAKQYQPQVNQGLRWYEMAITLIKAVEKAKATEVKEQVAKVHDLDLNRLVADVTG